MVIALAALGGFAIILSVFRDSLQNHFALSNARFGFLLTFGSLAGAAGALAGGRLSDRDGPWQAFRLFLGILAAGCSVGALAGGWLLLLASLGIVYFAYYALLISAQAGLVALFPDGRRRILSVFLVASAAACAVFPLVGEALLKAVAGGWLPFAAALHGVFGVVSLLALAGLAWLIRQPEPVPPAPAVAAESGKTGLVGGLWLLVALATLHVTCDAMGSTWIPRILTGPSYAVKWILPGTVLALFSLAYVLSRSMLGLMPENKWRRRLMVTPGLVGGTVLAAGLMTGTQAGAALGYVVGGFCWSVEYPVILATMAGDRRFGQAMALLNVVSGVLCFVLPTAQGFAVDGLHQAGRGSLEWLVLLAPAAGFMLIGVGGACWVRRFGSLMDRSA